MFAVRAGVALAGLAVAAAPSRVWAETAGAPLTQAETDTLPFTNAELEQALLARLLTPRDEPGPPRAHVAPGGPGAVRVQVGARSRVVALAGRTGAAAARVVALVIAELLSTPPDSSASVAPPTAAITSALRATPPARVVEAPPPAVTPDQRAAVRRLCLTGGVAKGFGNEELLAGTLDVDVVVPVGRGRFRLAPSIGLMITPTRNARTFDEVSFLGAALRMLGGAAVGPVDFLAGPLLSPYTIGGATPHDGLLFGGEAVARVAAPLATGLWLVAATRVDGYADRVRVHWADGRAYATPRVAIAVDIGLAWSWTS